MHGFRRFARCCNVTLIGALIITYYTVLIYQLEQIALCVT